MVSPYKDPDFPMKWETAINNAISSKHLEGVRRILIEQSSDLFVAANPHMLNWINHALSDAAIENSLLLMKLLVKYGADLNAPEPGQDIGVILQAASFGDLEMSVWLLQSGAKLNHLIFGRVGCYPLIRAIVRGKYDHVKLYVEHGAVINFVNDSGFSPLDFAHKNPEIAEYLRSRGAKPGSELPRDHLPKPPEPPGDIRQYVEQHFGKTEIFPLREVVPSDPTFDILQFPYKIIDVDVPYKGFVTSGMSAAEQFIPDGEKASEGNEDDDSATTPLRRTEIFMVLPPDWPTDEQAMRDKRYRWPFDWLRWLAAWPFENETCLRRTNLISNGEPPTPFAPTTRMCALAVGTISEWYREDGSVVHFLAMVPIDEKERAFALEHGPEILLPRIGQNISPIRPCVVE